MWRSLVDPPFVWAHTLDRILSAERPPSFAGPTLYLASDYGGTGDEFPYRVDVVVCADLEGSARWEAQRRAVRRDFLGDGRRMTYKKLSDRQRSMALQPFLEAALEIQGVCLALITRKTLRHLCVPLGEHDRFRTAAKLNANWKQRELEDAVRVSHLISCLVGGFSQPKQDIYWISDQDSLFANEQRKRDVSRLLGLFSSHYVSFVLGETAIGTTELDEGDRFEEDLASVADLVAGGLAETVKRLSLHCGGRIPTSIALELPGRLATGKADLISQWYWAGAGKLRRVAMLIEDQGGGRFSVSRHDMLVE